MADLSAISPMKTCQLWYSVYLIVVIASIVFPEALSKENMLLDILFDHVIDFSFNGRWSIKISIGSEMI